MLDKHIEEKLFDYSEIVPIIKKLGDEISEKFKGQHIVLVCVLKGTMTFYGHLLKYIHDVTIETDYIHIKSYNGTSNKAGEIKLIAKHTTDVKGKNVVIVEDIIDSGYTIEYLNEYFDKLNPKTISTVVLANKPHARLNNTEPTWYGIELNNDYVVGFGFDLNDNLRQLPYIGRLKKKYYTE